MASVIKNTVLYKDTHYFASFPSISLVKQDRNTPPRLLLLFRRARDSRWLLDAIDEESKWIKQQVDHVDSRSQITRMYFNLDLEPVSEAVSLSINPDAADQDASILKLSDQHLLLSSFSWYPVHVELANALRKQGNHLFGRANITGCGYILWGVYTRYSQDGGISWSEHNYLPALPNTHDIIPGKRPVLGGSCRGQAVKTDSEILLPVYATLKQDSVNSCHLYTSTDNGKSWHYHSVIARDPEQKNALNEPSLLHIENDTVMAFIRNSSHSDRIVTACSWNRGRTWENYQELDIIGHPVHPLKLSDGRIFICYGYRHKPFGIRAHLMDSTGSQLIGDEIIIRDDGSCGDLGYPWAVELPNGNVLVVYYFTLEDGIRHITGSIVEL